MHYPLLQDILILLGCSVGVAFLFQRIRLPLILGFLVTGVIIGPFGLRWVTAMNDIEVLAEIGIILLLFVIGMEFSLKQLTAIRKTVLLGGTLQVGLATSVVALAFYLFGFPLNKAVFFGFLFSLSSTAIVLKMLQDRNEINAPHGRIALGVLIFQDVIVVPMMLVTPMLAGETGNFWYSMASLLIKSVLIVAITLVSARYVVPRVLHIIARTRSKELFLLTTITLCLAVASLTAEIGLSLALGAFLAGLIISESDYSHQATGTILPFRELFSSFFFISIGMLLDLTFFFQHIGVVLMATLLVFLVKGLVVAITSAILRYPPRTVMLTGLILFQVGEFAFILSKVGLENGLLSVEMNQYFLSVSILTMAATPFVFMYSNRISHIMRYIPFGRFNNGSRQDVKDRASDEKKWEDHLVIIGYGLNGKNVAKAARYANIPYVIIELNASTVREEKAKGEHILFGDPVHEHVLHEVKVKQARVVVIAISDPQATKTIVTNVRNMSTSVYIIVRTRFVKEIDELTHLGANEVIPEEFETSLEIFSRVLQRFLVPIDEMENLVNAIRAGNYEVLRPQHPLKKGISPMKIPNLNIESIRVLADSGDVVGKTLAESDIRKEYGINILAITRNKKTINQVLPEEKIRQHDLLFVSGSREQISKFYKKVN